MRAAIFISIALLTGWVTTSSLDTQKRLKSIEKQHADSLKKLDDATVKLANLINDANFEAQQAKTIAEISNRNLSKLDAILQSISATGEHNQLQLARIIKTLQYAANSTSLNTTTNSGSTTASEPTPPVLNAPKIDIIESHSQRMREREALNTTRALEGIREELRDNRFGQ